MSERKGTKALELWCKRLVKDCPNVQIENMTTSWRNGLAFCALVHHFRPDLIDVSSLNPENVYENNQLAFSVAEKHLGIPALLDPEDMVENEIPDRLSILTYLSQFYQRLGHTVNTKASEHECKLPSPSSTQSTAPFMLSKAGLDKCAACGLPVYLAQRLIVSHKLYHRRCFRCSKCCGHLNPKNFEVIDRSDFSCDSCKNEQTVSSFLNNNDQMGMLAFTDEPNESENKLQGEEKRISPKLRSKPLSILERINKFENDMEKESIENKLSNINLKDNEHKHKDLNTSSFLSSTSGVLSDPSSTETDSNTVSADTQVSEKQSPDQKTALEKSYKTNVNKHVFLQTQLSGEGLETGSKIDDDDADVTNNVKQSQQNFVCDVGDTMDQVYRINNKSSAEDHKESNITDDIRLAKTHSESPNLDTFPLEENDLSKNKELSISVPPRRKRKVSPKLSAKKEVKSDSTGIQQNYPDELNPFSDEEDKTEEETKNSEVASKKVSTNPFGSSDEEDDEVPPIPAPSKTANTSPAKRHITALNPFWSDNEEPSSEDESNNSSSIYKTTIASSTPNLPGAMAARHKKGRAPPPPPPELTVEPPPLDQHYTSMDDVASISSYSSYTSTIHSDQKSFGKITPRFKKRPAPTPPDSVSTASVSGSMERGLDSTMRTNTSDQSGRKVKGPAPGLPLPERREVKLQMSPEDLQVQMDLLETQQLGLERQGVLIEQMIRDKCEGDEECTTPPEEVEDLVIQLCELVNEKNDLFRKQTELMYIRRQQRLEQEQADIEHEIRVIQSRPAVNRIDADKAREEQLVARLVQVVLLRDELVQQIDAERRRERREDLAIAASIAAKRAQRNSGSNSSSVKSAEDTPIPKKNKIKDKFKKQLKKAKHSLISKKKDDSGECKEIKTEKEK